MSEPSEMVARVEVAGSLPAMPARVTVDVKHGERVLSRQSAEVPLQDVAVMTEALLQAAVTQALRTLDTNPPPQVDLEQASEHEHDGTNGLPGQPGFRGH